MCTLLWDVLDLSFLILFLPELQLNSDVKDLHIFQHKQKGNNTGHRHNVDMPIAHVVQVIWFQPCKDAHSADCWLIKAQSGHSGIYLCFFTIIPTDFGVWRDNFQFLSLDGEQVIEYHLCSKSYVNKLMNLQSHSRVQRGEERKKTSHLHTVTA